MFRCANLTVDIWTDLSKVFDELAKEIYQEDEKQRNKVTHIKDTAVIEIEVPGVPKERIKIRSNDGKLTVRAPNRRGAGWTKSYSLPNYDLIKTKVKLKDGLLTITVPKAEDAKERDIPID